MSSSANELVEQRRRAARSSRRIIMNTDGGDTSQAPADEPKTPENFLKYRVSPLAGSQVDAILDCTAGEFFSLDPEREEHDLPMGGGPVHGWARVLSDQGYDGLQLKIDFGHANDMEVFRSFRMNDTHDSKLTDSVPRWKKDHPDCLLGKQGETPAYGGWRWSGLDYGTEPVQEKVFCVIEETCRRYDIDGIDLDFYRHPHYFRPQMSGDPVTQRHCDVMTDFLKRVRQMTDKVALQRGRPLLVIARVFDSVGYSKAIGLDVERWMAENLVDMLAGGGYDHLEPWENLAELGERHDIPVYACISASHLKRSRFLDPESLEETKGWMTRRHPLFRPVWRGEAINAWEAGVSGIYTFNLHDPGDDVFREIGSLKTLEGLEAVYEFNPGIHAGNWLKGGENFIRPPEAG